MAGPACSRRRAQGRPTTPPAWHFSVTGEPEFGEFEPPVVLARYGEVPAEFC